MSIPTFFEIASIAESQWFDFQPFEKDEKVTGISSRIMGGVKTMKGKVSGIVDSNIVFYKDCASFSFGTSKEFRHEIQDFLNGLSSKHNKHNFDHFLHQLSMNL